MDMQYPQSRYREMCEQTQGGFSAWATLPCSHKRGNGMETILAPACFQNPAWLKSQVFSILNFYYPRCMDDANEGYYNCFLDDGTICDPYNKHLVSTTRFIYDFSIGLILGRQPAWYKRGLERGIHYLQRYHLDPVNGGYYWMLRNRQVTDATKFAYGHAFVLLAAARAASAGFLQAERIVSYTYDVLEEHFWEPRYGLYRDQMSADWSKVSPYRGQNANMHLCEAMIAAYEATGESKYLARAHTLAQNVTVGLASQSDGWIWENFYPDWSIDWTYIERDPFLVQFRPTGFVPGHQIEWSKLLLILDRYAHESWMRERSDFLYRAGFSRGADEEYGGIFYLLSPQWDVIDPRKMHWVQAEAIGASALRAVRPGSECSWETYTVMFSYCWSHLIDTVYGGWYNILSREGVRLSDVKSPLTKTDYHPISNCYETLRALGVA